MTHITSIEIENLKRVKAIRLEPGASGLTVIGGKNGQGKTSVLDGIAWALGGAKQAPSNPKRDGSMNDPHITLSLSNGLRVERKGKNGSLTVTDPSGTRGGQALLDAFISSFALDLPKFMQSSNKAQQLLQVLGIGDQLAQMDREEKALYESRRAIGQIADAKAKHAAEMPEYGDAPDEPLSVSALIQAQQKALAKNGENQRLRERVTECMNAANRADQTVADLQAKLAEALEVQAKARSDYATAQKSAEDLHDESTAEIERQIAQFEAINAQVAANQAKAAAADEAEQHRADYDAKTEGIEKIRADRMALLASSPLPLDGLSVENAELVYNGQRWDCMSGSDQLRVAVAIVRALQPECGFVLMDKLEQMDLDTLQEFGAWLEAEGLQVIATRVSTGGECSIVIEDGLPVGQSYADVVTGVNGSDETETEYKF